MRKFIVFTVLFSALFLFSSQSWAQSSDSAYVIHVQTWKMSSRPTGDDAKAFYDMLRKQSEIISNDPRIVHTFVVRHYWGNDSRDLVFITEFTSLKDLFSFYDDMGSMLEKALSKEELEKGNTLWAKYAGYHSDEIYGEVPGTRK
jgi:hypothetical protein